ncbi:hypothetical protein S40285_02820 [Stachybotrys chlorohalonatus IBT 40285]|uniref:Histone deacetylase complex subunit SAP30 Sin3 binding domain-containing protein n=1 Tax=Stachybotrys chlorohalonatus (strain IBT 40285) TaxID=1283841 RepID=A0A084QD72_STAC4|nr:hypothetical protein S40285_02820 [Stachybotrys chlorohalonata IBT 40285]
MPPPKSSRNHDDAKADSAGTKEKSGSHHTSTKMRRVASQSTAAQIREAAAVLTSTPHQPPPEPHAPSLSWPSFDREVLHAYRREHRLNTPTSFASSYHQCVLSQPSGIGLYSPTMARKKGARRQSKDRLAMAVRKHFNGIGAQENEVIVEFIYNIRSDNARKETGPNKEAVIITE